MDYLRVRASVLFFQSIAPISLVYVCLRIFHFLLPGSWNLLTLPPPLVYWLGCEAFTFIFLYLPYKHFWLQRPALHPPALPREEREKLFSRCWATVEDPEKHLRGWFLGASEDEIRRENVREFIHWAFFNTQDLAESEHEEMEDYLERIGVELGRPLLPGRGDARCLRSSLDPIRCSYRPLLWNLVQRVAVLRVSMTYADTY